jgi:hypothetical protein
MKKQVLYFVAAVVVIIVCVVLNGRQFGFNTAGGGLSLKEANDTTKSSVVVLAEANTNTEENMAQALAIGNWEHQYHNGLYLGADFIGTVSTQFGVCAPTCDFRAGVMFDKFNVELKAGNFTRNSVKTLGFDPQFQNNLLLMGEGVSVSNAVQLAVMSKSGKIMVGHQGGNKFYSFNGGNWYVSAEQNIKNISLSGGVNFTEKTSGYAAAKLTTGNNVFTATFNNLGTENHNYVLSYVYNNINLGKGVKMNVGSAFCSQPEKKGLQLVAGFSKGRTSLFAQAGGRWLSTGFNSMVGLGLSQKL